MTLAVGTGFCSESSAAAQQLLIRPITFRTVGIERPSRQSADDRPTDNRTNPREYPLRHAWEVTEYSPQELTGKAKSAETVHTSAGQPNSRAENQTAITPPAAAPAGSSTARLGQVAGLGRETWEPANLICVFGLLFAHNPSERKRDAALANRVVGRVALSRWTEVILCAACCRASGLIGLQTVET